MALAAAAIPSPVHAQTESPSARAALLDVPYLPQSEALCGGAAIAMVMRYWGTTGVYAETFADLVDAEANGIRGSDLIRALGERGFETSAFEGDAARVQAALAARRPPVALIEDRPGRFHYVVVVGWRDDRVIVHDPARAPFRVLPAAAFVRAWSASRYWTLLAQPRDGAAVAIATAAAAPAPAGSPAGSSGVCAGMVEEGIRLAGAGDLPGAEHVLELAAADCSRDAAPRRELAGVYALRADWARAAVHARAALDRDPADRHAARILATSLFLTGDDAPALDAWNRIEAPVIDIVDIRGLDRTRFAIAAAALDLPVETVLTRERLDRARRRIDALPSVLGSRVTYTPTEDDRARVTAAVLERPLVPAGAIPLAAIAVRAATDREVGLAVASPTGGGELWTAAWRWWERRPRIALGLSAPAPFGGVWSVDAFTERQTYGSTDPGIIERRRGAAVTWSDWLTGGARLQVAASVDRWDDGPTALLQGGIERVWANGLAAASAHAGAITGTRRAGLAGASAEWQSTRGRAGPAWHARAGVSIAGSDAPLALWPGAGTGQGRDALLRAHPLLHDGAVRGVFGRRLLHGGAEWRYWMGSVFRTLHVAPAVFVDVARSSRTPAFGDRRAHVDAGAGLRIAVPGAGVVRIDVGKGLRDGSTALSFGWTR